MKKIIVMGASRYNIMSIQALRKAGFFVIGADKNPNAPAFPYCDVAAAVDIVDAKAITELAREYQVDGILPTNEYAVPSASVATTELGLPGITPEMAVLFTMKEEMRKAWDKAGVPCPQFETAVTKDDFRRAVDRIGFPCILKPAYGLGGGSRGIIVVRSREEMDDAIAFSQSFYPDKPETLVETFVEAEYEHSAEVPVYQGEAHVLAISDKINTPLPFRIATDVIYPTRVSGERLQKLKETLCQAALSLGLRNGVAHVELATTKDGFYLYEAGARCGGGGTPAPIVSYVTGVDEVVEVARILTGQAPVHLEPVVNRACNYRFIMLPAGTVKDVSGVDEVRKQKDVLDFDFFVKPGDVLGGSTNGLDRRGFIIVGGETPEQVYKRSLELESMIHVTMA